MVTSGDFKGLNPRTLTESNNVHKTTAITMAALCVSFAVCHAQDDTPAKPTIVIPKIQKQDVQSVERFAVLRRDLHELHRALARGVCELARRIEPKTIQDEGRKASAMRLLELIGNGEDVDFLVREIEFRLTVSFGKSSASNAFPAVDALKAIGTPARSRLFSELHHEVSKHRLDLCADVLAEIDGDLAVAIFRAERELKKCRAEQAAETKPSSILATYEQNLVRLIETYQRPEFATPQFPFLDKKAKGVNGQDEP